MTKKQSKAKTKAFKKVKITLFRDNDKYKNDVFTAVNGTNYLIQRGVEVEVPYMVAQVLKESEKNDHQAALKVEELTSKAKI